MENLLVAQSETSVTKEENDAAWEKLLQNSERFWDSESEHGHFTKKLISLTKIAMRKIDDDRRKETKTDCSL